MKHNERYSLLHWLEPKDIEYHFWISEFRKGCWDTTYPSSLTTQHLGSSNKGLVGSSGSNGTSGVGGINSNSVSSGIFVFSIISYLFLYRKT